MAQINWERARESPASTVCAFGYALCRIAYYATGRIFNIFSAKQFPSLRTATGNIVCATLTAWDASLLLDAPKSVLCETNTLTTDDFTAFVSTTMEELLAADVVVLYCHGGGYSVGHPLQYRSMYARWQRKARERGLRLSVVSLRYPLAPKHPYPAQLKAALAAYEHLLRLVTPEKVCIAGESAGGNLVAALVFHIRDTAKVPQPGRSVLSSPWLDLTMSNLEYHECLDRDILVAPAFMRTYLVPQFVGECKASDPRISPLLSKDFRGLPPQLVIYGTLEVMQDEAKLWIEKCRQAAVPTSVYAGRHALHGFGVGGLLCSADLENEVDENFLAFLMKEV